MLGEVAILNVGAGDTKLTFDNSDKAEVKKAAKTVKDMIRRGFVLLIEVGVDDKGRPTYRRALDFDEEAKEYIIAGTTEEPPTEKTNAQPQSTTRSRQKGNARTTTRIPATKTKAIGVARTAGG